jgi:hypothetical protein
MKSKYASIVLCLFAVFAVNAGFAGNPNNWVGPYDSGWNTPASWSLGTVPGASDDVTIYSGSNDWVLLNTSSTINSLTLGGATNGTTSLLHDINDGRILNITQSLTIGQTGKLELYGLGSLVNAATLVNNGYAYIGTGATLNLTQLNVTDVPTGSLVRDQRNLYCRIEQRLQKPDQRRGDCLSRQWTNDKHHAEWRRPCDQFGREPGVGPQFDCEHHRQRDQLWLAWN